MSFGLVNTTTITTATFIPSGINSQHDDHFKYDQGHANPAAAYVQQGSFISNPNVFENPVYQPYKECFVPKPQLTQAIHKETLRLLTKADELSGTILYGKATHLSSDHAPVVHAPIATKAAAPSFNFDFSDHSWKMFNSESHVHHHHYHDGEEDKKKDETGVRILVGFIGLVAALATAFFVGKAIADGEEGLEENETFEDLKTRWSINKYYYEHDYQLTVDNILRKTDAILQRKQTNRTHNISLLVLGFISGGAAFAGAVVGSSVLMLGATAGAGVVGVLVIFKLGYSCFSNRDNKDAKVIDNGLVKLDQKHLVIIG